MAAKLSLGLGPPRAALFVLAQTDRNVASTSALDAFREVQRTAFTSVSPDVSMLDPTDEPSVTLVTCSPLYHVGNAPQRYIAKGTLDRSRT